MSISIIICGFLTIFCALMDYDWFMKHRKAAFFVFLFGRGGARVFYVILGVIVILLGFFGDVDSCLPLK